jgi:hypothetical protein
MLSCFHCGFGLWGHIAFPIFVACSFNPFKEV